jgi:hypothetical protein
MIEIKNVLHSMDGTSLYGLLSICLFFGLFIGLVVWIIRLKKPYLKKMRELPLNDESAPESGVEQTPNPKDRHD